MVPKKHKNAKQTDDQHKASTSIKQEYMEKLRNNTNNRFEMTMVEEKYDENLTTQEMVLAQSKTPQAESYLPSGNHSAKITYRDFKDHNDEQDTIGAIQSHHHTGLELTQQLQEIYNNNEFSSRQPGQLPFSPDLMQLSQSKQLSSTNAQSQQYRQTNNQNRLEGQIVKSQYIDEIEPFQQINHYESSPLKTPQKQNLEQIYRYNPTEYIDKINVGLKVKKVPKKIFDSQRQAYSVDKSVLKGKIQVTSTAILDSIYNKPQKVLGLDPVVSKHIKRSPSKTSLEGVFETKKASNSLKYSSISAKKQQPGDIQEHFILPRDTKCSSTMRHQNLHQTQNQNFHPRKSKDQIAIDAINNCNSLISLPDIHQNSNQEYSSQNSFASISPDFVKQKQTLNDIRNQRRESHLKDNTQQDCEPIINARNKFEGDALKAASFDISMQSPTIQVQAEKGKNKTFNQQPVNNNNNNNTQSMIKAAQNSIKKTIQETRDMIEAMKVDSKMQQISSKTFQKDGKKIIQNRNSKVVNDIVVLCDQGNPYHHQQNNTRKIESYKYQESQKDIKAQHDNKLGSNNKLLGQANSISKKAHSNQHTKETDQIIMQNQQFVRADLGALRQIITTSKNGSAKGTPKGKHKKSTLQSIDKGSGAKMTNNDDVDIPTKFNNNPILVTPSKNIEVTEQTNLVLKVENSSQIQHKNSATSSTNTTMNTATSYNMNLAQNSAKNANSNQTGLMNENIKVMSTKEKNQQMDAFMKTQQLQVNKNIKDNHARKDRDMLRIFLKKQGYEGVDDKIVCILNQKDNYLKRAVMKKGWHENPVANSFLFDVKWDYNDNPAEYNNMKASQLYNHFPDGRELTTKQGLNKNVNSITHYGTDIYKFYPRSYDLSDIKQIDEFEEEFNRTAILNIVKKHAKIFKKVLRAELEPIFKQDAKIADNIFKQENKKKLKKQYHTIYPSKEHSVQLGLINTVLLQNAIFFAKNLLNDLNETCEGDEYIKKDFMVQRFQIADKVKEYLYIYSKLTMPVMEIPDSATAFKRMTGWEDPNYYLMYITIKIHKELKKSIYQYKAIDSSNNVWICKPSYNARGVGIFCFDNPKDIYNGSLKRQPAPKIVQKYIERSLLLHGLPNTSADDYRKFDVRQWVFVSSFDPLKIYIYGDAYIRICGSSFDLGDIGNHLKHLSNFSLQKVATTQNNTTVSDLVMSSDQFVEHLHKQDPSKFSRLNWEHFRKQIENIVAVTINQVRENVEPRPNSFELFGFDFVVDKDLNCWLLEANMSPACSERTPWLSEMLDDMADGMLNIVEKKIIMNNKFNGKLGDLQLQYQTKKAKPDIGKWIKLNDKNKDGTADQGQYSPMKGRINQQMQYNATNNLSFRANANILEIQGQKCSIKYEKKIDKQFKERVAVQFIQKFWRGYLVRSVINQNKLQTILREQKKKKGIILISEILDLAFARYDQTNIEAIGFYQIKYMKLVDDIAKDQDNLIKVQKIQKFYRDRLQANPITRYLHSRQINYSDQASLDITSIQGNTLISDTNNNSRRGSNIMNQTISKIATHKNDGIRTKRHNQTIYNKKLVQQSIKKQKIAQNQRRTALKTSRIKMIDKDMLLDFQNLGITEIVQPIIQDAPKKQNGGKQNKNDIFKNTTQNSPYLSAMKLSTIKAFRQQKRGGGVNIDTSGFYEGSSSYNNGSMDMSNMQNANKTIGGGEQYFNLSLLLSNRD